MSLFLALVRDPSQQPFGGRPDAFVVGHTISCRQTREHRSHSVVRPRVGALQQYLPSTLEIWYRTIGFPQSSFLGNSLFHPLSDVKLTSNWSPQHSDPFRLPCFCPDVQDVIGHHPCLVPRSTFALVQPYARYPHHSFLKNLVQRLHTCGFTQQIHVVQERAKLLPVLQVSRPFLQDSLNPNRKEKWHERVTLLAALGLGHCAPHSIFVVPRILRRLSVRQPHEREECPGCGHAQESPASQTCGHDRRLLSHPRSRWSQLVLRPLLHATCARRNPSPPWWTKRTGRAHTLSRTLC